MTADRLEAVPTAEPEPAAERDGLLPGRRYFTYKFEDWDGKKYTVHLKDIGWMPLRVLDQVTTGGDPIAGFRWGATPEEFEILQDLPAHQLETILDAWNKASDVTVGESPSSPESSATSRGGRRSKPT